MAMLQNSLILYLPGGQESNPTVEGCLTGKQVSPLQHDHPCIEDLFISIILLVLLDSNRE